ncbi:hypothetical protein T484DRAFT_2361384, partial [Baffinella frigidus]
SPARSGREPPNPAAPRPPRPPRPQGSREAGAAGRPPRPRGESRAPSSSARAGRAWCAARRTCGCAPRRTRARRRSPGARRARDAEAASRTWGGARWSGGLRRSRGASRRSRCFCAGVGGWKPAAFFPWEGRSGAALLGRPPSLGFRACVGSGVGAEAGCSTYSPHPVTSAGATAACFGSGRGAPARRQSSPGDSRRHHFASGLASPCDLPPSCDRKRMCRSLQRV